MPWIRDAFDIIYFRLFSCRFRFTAYATLFHCCYAAMSLRFFFTYAIAAITFDTRQRLDAYERYDYYAMPPPFFAMRR